MKVCPKCHAQNDDKNKFCNSCGTKLEESNSKFGFVDPDPAPKADPKAKSYHMDSGVSQGNYKKQERKKLIIGGSIIALGIVAGVGLAAFAGSNSSDSSIISGTASGVINEELSEDQSEQIQDSQGVAIAESSTQPSVEPQAVANNSADEELDIVTTEIPDFEMRPLLVGNGNYIFEENGKYGVINDQGVVEIEPVYEQYALREFSRTEKAQVDFTGYACLYDEPSETGTDAIDLAYCDKNEVFPWQQSYASRVLTSSGNVVDYEQLYYENEALIRDMQENYAYTLVEQSVYPTLGSHDVVDYYVYAQKVDRLFGPYEAGELAFFQLKPRLVKNNYLCDTIFYAKEDGKYRIYNHDATQSTSLLFDYAVPVSDDYMMVTLGDRVGLVDVNLNVMLFDGIEEISAASGGNAYVKSNGQWKLIDINDSDYKTADAIKVEKESVKEDNSSEKNTRQVETAALEEKENKEEAEEKTEEDPILAFLESEQYREYIPEDIDEEDLLYVIYDLNQDDTDELLIQAMDDSDFSTTWTFMVIDDEVELIDETYGFGSFRYSPDANAVLVSPQTRPSHNAAVQPFSQLTEAGYEELFAVGMDMGTRVIWDQDGQEIEITDEESETYYTDVVYFDWQSFES